MTDPIVITDVSEIAPEPPPRGAGYWMRENLFPSVGSSILTVLAAGIVVFGVSGLLNFLFSAARRWEAVTFNMRLLMVQAYPVEQFARVWLSVGIVFVLLGFSLALYRVGGKLSAQKLGRTLMAIGFALGGAFVLGYLNLQPFFNIDAGGGSVTARATTIAVVVGAVLAAIGWGLTKVKNPKDDTIPVMAVVGVALGLLVVAAWTVKLPVPIGDNQIEYQSIATSTAIPWTVIIALTVVAYLIGLAAVRGMSERVYATVRHVVVALWVATFPVIVLVILRDPDVDTGKVFGWYLPLALAFMLLGGALLWYLAGSKAGEAGRAIAGLIAIVAAVSFFFPMEFVVRFLLVSLAVFALGAHTFGGEGSTRRIYVGIWAAWVTVLVYLIAIVATPSTVEVPGSFFVGGLFLTFILAITSIALSFPLGVLLALGRTSTMPIFRLMSTVYIEVMRGVPLITWLLVAFLMLPVALPQGVEISGVMRAIIFMTLFSAAYLAENVRGGLQSIPRGQYEASEALGMSTVQTTVFITLPQALRAVIPAIVGQVIALFKDTSLVTVVGLFDLLHIARQVIPNQSTPFNFLGTIRETLIFVAIVYWIFTFTFSRISLRLEKKLGVGER